MMQAKTTAELIALLEADPGKYRYTSPGVGTPNQLTMVLFKKSAGVDVVHVPYKGGAPLYADMLGGRGPVAFASEIESKGKLVRESGAKFE